MDRKIRRGGSSDPRDRLTMRGSISCSDLEGRVKQPVQSCQRRWSIFFRAPIDCANDRHQVNSGGMTSPSRQLLEDQIRAACVLEATARKPGNVHPLRAFVDLTYQDFVDSADAAAPILAQTPEIGVGRAILDAVTATQARIGRNTNLGVILLLAPLAAVPSGVRLTDGIAGVLAGLTRLDAELAYEAIRLAHPGGMGRVDDQDVGTSPTLTLLEVMRLAADRDLIAQQYATDFAIVLDFGLPYLNAVAYF